jgi:hypothetical protein
MILLGWVSDTVNVSEDKKMRIKPTHSDTINRLLAMHPGAYFPRQEGIITVGSTTPLIRKFNQGVLEHYKKFGNINGVELTIKIKTQKYNIRGNSGIKFIIESIDVPLSEEVSA